MDNSSHVVIGTPDKVLSSIRDKTLSTSSIKSFCLEAMDEMIFRGFKKDILEVFQLIPQNCQVSLISCSMPEDVIEIRDKHMRDSIHICVSNKELSLQKVTEFYVDIEKEEWKLDTLRDFYEIIPNTRIIIFTNTRRKAEWVFEKMVHHKHKAVYLLHGEMIEKDRDNILHVLSSRSTHLLISSISDLSSFGIDTQNISCVLNYDIPINREDYIRRFGRSEHSRGKLVAINFLTSNDKQIMAEIEYFYNTKVEELPMDFDDLFRK